MSNKIETVSIGDLPIATELDDADELLLRDVSATLPENATARLSIATLRAAMVGGSPDRIESESGAAFAEATDDFEGAGGHAVVSGADANGGSGRVFAGVLPGEGPDLYTAFSQMWAGEEGNFANGVWISAYYDAETGMKGLEAEGAPLEIEEPTESNHAATKGYVDARPGAEEWSEHAATQDVDLDGHKITGLGEPTDATDAATKGYVDGAAPPDRIKGGAGTTYEETEIGVGPDATGNFSILLRGANRGDVFLQQFARENSSGIGWIGWSNSRSGYGRGYVRWTTSTAELYGAHAAGNFGRVYVDGTNGGNVYFDIPGANAGGGYELSKGIRLGSHSSHTPNVRALPSNVNSILHGIKLGVDAHDALASMPAPPELEWWEPVWTPVNNVDSVANVECSYTRVHRASGGSLVTLEGTVTVTPEAAGQCDVQVDLPIARVGSDLLAGTALAMEVTPPGHVVAVASVAETTLTLGFVAEGADPYIVGFRASYRAA